MKKTVFGIVAVMLLLGAYFTAGSAIAQISTPALWAAGVIFVVPAFIACLTRYRQKGLLILLLLFAYSIGVGSLASKTGFPYGSLSYSSRLAGPSYQSTPLLVISVWMSLALGAWQIGKRFGTDSRGKWLISTAVLALTGLVLNPGATKIGLWRWNNGIWGWVALLNFFGWALSGGVAMLFLHQLRVKPRRYEASLTYGILMIVWFWAWIAVFQGNLWPAIVGLLLSRVIWRVRHNLVVLTRKHHNPYTVSVVIPTLNEARYIGKILDDLAAQTYHPNEVIVVDGQSSDSTVAIAQKHPGVTIIHMKAQAARQRQRGAMLASGDIVIMCDADVRMRSNFIARSLREMDVKRLGIARPRYRSPKNASAFVKFYNRSLSAMFRFSPVFRPHGGGNCILVRRAVFSKATFKADTNFDDMLFVEEAAKYARFDLLKTNVTVSDRRYLHEGTIRLLFRYNLLSLLFSLNLYRLSKYITYEFGHYKSSD